MRYGLLCTSAPCTQLGPDEVLMIPFLIARIAGSVGGDPFSEQLRDAAASQAFVMTLTLN